jgi:hypothetical protein
MHSVAGGEEPSMPSQSATSDAVSEKELDLTAGQPALYGFELAEGTFLLERREALVEWLRYNARDFEATPFVLHDIAEFLDDPTLRDEAESLCALTPVVPSGHPAFWRCVIHPLPPHATRTIIAFAIDLVGKSIIEKLGPLGETPVTELSCYSNSSGSDQTSSARTLEHQNDRPRTQPSSAGVTAEFVGVLDATIRDALDLHSASATSPPPDLLDLLLVIGDWEHGSARLTSDVVPAFCDARQRYQRVGRTLLVVQCPFEPISPVLDGVLEWLPTALGSQLLDAFDLVLLMGPRTPDGLSVTARRIQDDLAGAVATLILSPLATSLDRSIRSEVAQLGDAQRFLGIGTAQIACSPDHARLAIANYLHRRMAALLQTPHLNGGTASSTARKELSEALVRVPNDICMTDGPDPANSPDRRWLERQFEKAQWDLTTLEPLQDVRNDVLRTYASKARGDLAALMSGPFDSVPEAFAHWYAREKSGLNSRPEPVHHVTYNTNWSSAFASIALVAIAAGAVALGLIPIAVAAFIASVIPMAWLRRKEETIEMPPPLPDWGPAHRHIRARFHWTHQLVERSQRDTLALRQNRKQLAKDAIAQGDSPPGLMPLPDEVCGAVLAAAKIDAKGALEAFWRSGQEGITASLSDGTDALPNALWAHAQRLCAHLGNVNWVRVIDLLGGDDAFDTPFMQELLDRLRTLSQPRMPVLGEHTQTLVALPLGTPQKWLDIIGARFPGRTTVETAPIDGMTVVQWTQGYRLADP